ncbi:hypothetical protein, partial [Flavobacterium bizetiae]|uniref:hypothetical protein n=1 Tax=Flavobacterium bizetiae TaxID=2704140 RepID=UPI001E400D06
IQTNLNKTQSWVLLVVWVSRKDAKALSFDFLDGFFFSFISNVLLKAAPLAPIVVEILLCRGSAQKIGVDSGK